MKTYTVIAYDVQYSGHRVETVEAESPTEAAKKHSDQHAVTQYDIEIVGVIEGQVQFCPLDHTALNLAPFAS